MKAQIETPFYDPNTALKRTPSSPTTERLTLLSGSPGEQRDVTLQEAIETLNTYWPHLFPFGILRPMALDITEQLLANKQRRKLTLTPKRLTRCVSVILNSVAYQATLMPAALRYDLFGQPQALITQWES
ncbi:ProQ/FINO family protein [Providencia rettgeri]|uniref:Conjugal transfer repressor n=1 Tax=Providencia rettgeri TaxID=587 RepID=A0A379FU06_PRORE|nr:ProQ/FINO family protein [Providencia rettgeri]QXB04818.1 hypothetical protein I6L80_15760 [Providencia rettgeri]SUC32127.1 Conjugal transfer repressor [Providencia rettgeri]